MTKTDTNTKEHVILTGDRPTGPLHLGHYVGSLKQRVALQDKYTQYILIADTQALTDNAENPKKVHDNVLEVALDYLATGIDPKKSTIFIQSQVPELSELTMYYLNLVSVARLQRNPTIKEEIKQRGFNGGIPAGFLTYPVSQAADITAFQANLVPVGEDQLPMIEQTNEIVRSFNRIYNTDALVEAEAFLSETSKLPGIDGHAKMSKSLGNCIFLKDDEKAVAEKVKSMFTDPNHLRVEDPGKVEGNPVFTYLDAFATDRELLASMKEHYQRGGLGDVKVKAHLLEVLEDFLGPIRERRQELAKDPAYVFSLLKQGTEAARETAAKTLDDVRDAVGVRYF